MTLRTLRDALFKAATLGLLFGATLGTLRGAWRVADNAYLASGFVHNAAAELLFNLARLGGYGILAGLLLGPAWLAARAATGRSGAAALAVLLCATLWAATLQLIDALLRAATPGSLDMLSTIYFGKLETAPFLVQLEQYAIWLFALLLSTTLLGLILRLLARPFKRPAELLDRAWGRLAGLRCPPLPALALLLLVLAAPRLALAIRPASQAAPLNAVLISLDTVRADHVGLYGYGRPTTPRLDRLAEDALVFEQAVSQAPWTLPSHATIMTGLFPSVHGADNYHSRLTGGLTLLPEVLRESGWATLAVTSHILLSPSFGFDQGWDRCLFLGEPGAAAVTDAALGLIEHIDRPYLLFVHYFDAHAPYTPPPQYAALFDSGYDGPVRGSVEELHSGKLAERDVERLIELYDAELRLLDDEVGRLIEAVRRRPDAERTVIVLLGDHGEAFGEHGEFEHRTLHDEVLHVPLLIWPPALVQIDSTPRRVAAQVSLADVAPTLAAWSGLSLPAGQGRDLSPLLRADPAARPAPAFAEESAAVDLAGLTERAVRHAGIKYIEHGPDCALYRLGDDPAERDNLCPADPDAVGYAQLLDDAAALHAQARSQLLSGGLAPAEFTPDRRALERLKALGYLQ